ncbi:DEAD/DEAH box helicase [Candidatus Woesearchaeota archaeon]|nr:DEAD/DEAH box helicase [Candidatus Woesearchaeota archaeon]MBI2660637.1 DEAD/DEAH box helicase [Candidatus Woesearchaeota archaeon]
MDIKGITLMPEFEKAVMDLGFSEFTEIQEKCIPLIQQGRDVIGLSHTGSGKTAAFGFPALEKVVPGKGIQLLVLVPTRELCLQVAKEFRKFTKYRKTSIVEVYGGVSIGPQMHALPHADVVVGTPGRMLDVISRNAFDSSRIKILILDEADKMFEMGFIEDVREIVSTVPKGGQKLLFSATMSTQIMDIAKTYMKNPEKVKMPVYVDKSKLIQNYYECDRRDKFSLLSHIIKKDPTGLKLVFCSTRHIVDIIDKNLNRQGIQSQALHGGMSQSRRKQVMDAFKNQQLEVLVASDVAARGLDIKNVNLVINYDIPKTSQEYVHRIGRTARAGEEGNVISLLCQEDHENFRSVLQDRSLLINKLKTPEFERVEFIRPQRSYGGNRQFGRQQRGGFQGRPRFHGGGGFRGSRRY